MSKRNAAQPPPVSQHDQQIALSRVRAVRSKQLWTHDEDQLVMSSLLPDAELAQTLGRSMYAIAKRRSKLRSYGFTPAIPNRKAWAAVNRARQKTLDVEADVLDCPCRYKDQVKLTLCSKHDQPLLAFEQLYEGQRNAE